MSMASYVGSLLSKKLLTTILLQLDLNAILSESKMLVTLARKAETSQPYVIPILKINSSPITDQLILTTFLCMKDYYLQVVLLPFCSPSQISVRLPASKIMLRPPLCAVLEPTTATNCFELRPTANVIPKLLPVVFVVTASCGDLSLASPLEPWPSAHVNGIRNLCHAAGCDNKGIWHKQQKQLFKYTE